MTPGWDRRPHRLALAAAAGSVCRARAYLPVRPTPRARTPLPWRWSGARRFGPTSLRFGGSGTTKNDEKKTILAVGETQTRRGGVELLHCHWVPRRAGERLVTLAEVPWQCHQAPDPPSFEKLEPWRDGVMDAADATTSGARAAAVAVAILATVTVAALTHFAVLAGWYSTDSALLKLQRLAHLHDAQQRHEPPKRCSVQSFRDLTDADCARPPTAPRPPRSHEQFLVPVRLSGEQIGKQVTLHIPTMHALARLTNRTLVLPPFCKKRLNTFHVPPNATWSSFADKAAYDEFACTRFCESFDPEFIMQSVPTLDYFSFLEEFRAAASSDEREASKGGMVLRVAPRAKKRCFACPRWTRLRSLHTVLARSPHQTCCSRWRRHEAPPRRKKRETASLA